MLIRALPLTLLTLTASIHPSIAAKQTRKHQPQAAIINEQPSREQVEQKQWRFVHDTLQKNCSEISKQTRFLEKSMKYIALPLALLTLSSLDLRLNLGFYSFFDGLRKQQFTFDGKVDSTNEKNALFNTLCTLMVGNSYDKSEVRKSEGLEVSFFAAGLLMSSAIITIYTILYRIIDQIFAQRIGQRQHAHFVALIEQLHTQSTLIPPTLKPMIEQLYRATCNQTLSAADSNDAVIALCALCSLALNSKQAINNTI